MRKVLLPTLAVVLLIASNGDAYENCNGIGYFALQVPNSGSMNPDGNKGDWAWYDPEFIIGPDQMCNTLGGGMPTLDDFDIAVHFGWAPEPDNRFYAFVTVTDDTLNLDNTNVDDFWNDDDLELIVDANHGNWAEANNAIRVDHQQLGFHIPGEGRPEAVTSVRFQQPPEMQWPVTEGTIEAAVNVSPSPTHGATNTTSNYEIRMVLYDQLQPGGAGASSVHTLAAGETIGMSVTYNDADCCDRTHQISTHVNEAGAHESEFTAEVTMLSSGEFATAVESKSWGAVKSLLR